MKKRFLDFVAALCFCFNVDWDKDFPDDEFCLEKKAVRSGPVVVEIAPGADVPRAS